MNLQEHSFFFISGSHEFAYYGDNENPVDNFHIQSLHDSVLRICQYFNMDCNFFLKSNDDAVSFLEDCISNSQPALLIADSKLFTYQTPPDYLKNTAAKHMVLIRGADTRKKVFYAFDTYVYETTDIRDNYEVDLSYDKVQCLSSAAYRIIPREKFNTIGEVRINYRIILHHYLYADYQSGINALTAFGDDLERLKTLPNYSVRQYLEDIHYFLKIRYGFANLYFENMMDEILYLPEQKAIAAELYEKYLKAWSYLYARLILSNYMNNPQIVDCVIAGIRQIEECQKLFLSYLYSHCKDDFMG